jgi:hypothetical protein
MKNSILVKTVLIAASLPLLAGCIVERQPRRAVVVQEPAATDEVIVAQPSEPPPLRVEVVPVAPDPTFIWIGGVWEWRGRWVWARGHWDHPHPHAVWARGHWEHRPNGYVWIHAGWH